MALIRKRDLQKMNAKERESKMLELKLELIKSGVTANKTNAQTKELKRAFARLLTLNRIDRGEAQNKKK
ncbi:hypothetical protein J4408_02325 [Candidatus Pacearchaeota archaeon]|nr:hypothetical protein [Candidatus Pacearchaeota archaeon]